jgi:amidase
VRTQPRKKSGLEYAPRLNHGSFLMDRRDFLATAAVAAGAPLAKAGAAAGDDRSAATASGEPSADLSLGDISAAFADGRLTARQLTEMYLARIDRLDRRGPMLGAVIELNGRALEMAAELDAERKSRGPRGPLHGVPILVKDNVETSDHMMSTVGSLAMLGWYAPKDAPVIARLRAAGAVILGKTNLSE